MNFNILKYIRRKAYITKKRLTRNHKSKTPIFYSNPDIKNDLIMFDDFLPNMIGSWRSFEMSEYLKHFVKVQLVCLLNVYSFKNFKGYNFEDDKKLFLERYNLWDKANSIVAVEKFQINVNAKLAYCLFFNNLKHIYPILLEHQIPFVFTLYPGGGFKFYDDECDKFLTLVRESNLFKGVVVTQQSTKNYLINRLFFKEEKIKFIYGCTLETEQYKLDSERPYYKSGKNSLDICFVASKYTKYGMDKGFDVLCETILYFSKKTDNIRFHIVGGFKNEDLLFAVNPKNVFFYGIQPTNWFKKFYSQIDIILSPVKNNIVGIGSFDGFPTAAVIEAGLYGALMMSADPNGDNIYPLFEDKCEYLSINSNVNSVVEKINYIMEDPKKLRSIAKNGAEKLRELFSSTVQVNERIDFLKEIIIKIDKSN